MTLQWEDRGNGDHMALSGDLPVATVVTRLDGVVAWDIHGVQMKWTAKGFGEARNVRTAKAAVALNWGKWLKRAGLQPAPLANPAPSE